jgi:hypothetical protein
VRWGWSPIASLASVGLAAADFEAAHAGERDPLVADADARAVAQHRDHARRAVLFVTLKTVEVHLGRTQLVAALMD